MKRTRFSSRNHISADATELARPGHRHFRVRRQAGGRLLGSSCLAEVVDSLLANGAEDDLNAALDRLFDTNPVAHDELADMVEARPSNRIAVAGQGNSTYC